MRYLAIDPGDKRTGLALGDDMLRIASPQQIIEAANPDQRLRALLTAIEEIGPDALVIGLPLNMDGTPGPAAKKAKELADQLHQATQLPVHLMDERLTSAVADEQMSRTGLTHRQKKARRDALAAAAILRDFFDTLPPV